MDCQDKDQAMDNQAPVDPWIAAFAALEPKGEEASEAAAGDGVDGGADALAADADVEQRAAAEDESGNGDEDAGTAGGLGDNAGEPGGEAEASFFDFYGVDEGSIEQYQEELAKGIKDRAINDIAAEFVKRGVRNQNGKLGATIDDADVCKRDADGVPHFYNPETGQEFRGDNPRRQAQEWVDDYNKELARVFNNACEQYEKHLTDEAAPQLAVRKFAPKYKQLDDIRRSMFDSVIEDYEIRNDKNEIIGYSCDLDKALAMVERQVGKIQAYAKQHAPQQKEHPSGPALDMPANGGGSADNLKPPTSLAEAMERAQDKLLADMRKR